MLPDYVIKQQSRFHPRKEGFGIQEKKDFEIQGKKDFEIQAKNDAKI